MDKGNVKKALANIGKLFVSAIKANINKRDVKASGRLEQSIKFESTEDILSVYSDSVYGRGIEEGYKPKEVYPSIDAMREWIAKKGIKPRPRSKKTCKFIKLKDYHYKSLPFVLAAAVKKNGTIKRFNLKGAKIFEQAFQEVLPKINNQLKEAFMEDINKELNIIIQANGSDKK